MDEIQKPLIPGRKKEVKRKERKLNMGTVQEQCTVQILNYIVNLNMNQNYIDP